MKTIKLILTIFSLLLNLNTNAQTIQNQTKISIPFELYRNKIRMKCEVNGKQLYCLLDNGSLWDELLLFGSPRIDSLNLKVTNTTFLGDSTIQNPIIADIDTSVNIVFDNIEFQHQKAIITRYISGLPNLWEGCDVQISAAFFKNYATKIDFDKLIITLIPKETFSPPLGYQEIDMLMGPNNSRLIPVSILQSDSSTINMNLLIDLGGIYSIYLPLGKGNGIALPSKSNKVILANGFYGPEYGFLSTIKAIKIGDILIKDVQAAYQNVKSDANEYGNSMIGIGLLKEFELIFFYPNEKLYIKR